MRQAKTLMIGTTLGALLAWAAPGVLAQTAPSGQTSQSQTQDKGAAKNSAKPATPQPAKQTAGAAQQPAKGSSTTAQSPAGQTPAKNSAKPATPQAAKQTAGGAQQPAKASPPATQASKSQGPAKGDAKAPQKASASAQPAKTDAGAAKGQESTAAKAPAKASKQAAKKAAPSTPGTAKAEPKKKAEPKPKKASAKPAQPSGGATAQKEEPKIARRDPFESLVGRERSGDSGPRLPGKAGLVISQLRLDGVVRYVDGMIAVVTNPQSRTYFLREGDQLYDGRVAKISMDGVSFHEVGKDAFGKPVEREVSKRMYPSPGETQ